MKRKDWFLILFPLLVILFIDHSTKLWGQSLASEIQWFFFTFKRYPNQGAFLGFFANLPPLLRVVSLSTLGAFLIFSFAITQFLLPVRSMRLRLGLSFLLGGIIGNVYDRIIWSYVIDFVIIDLPWLRQYPFNLADLFQWTGYVLLAAALLREKDQLWPQYNFRRNMWINSEYQTRYIMFLMIVALSLTLIGTVFSYTYLKVAIHELVGNEMVILNRILIPYVITYLAISLTFCCLLVVIGRKVSHRSAGPVYAFDKYINDLLDGRNRRFKLRANDEFLQLEVLGLRVAEFLTEHNLLDTEDGIKTLTTQEDDAEDLSIAAVPVAEQIPNYSKQALSSGKIAELHKTRKKKKCPLCAASAAYLQPSANAHNLFECLRCHFVFDPFTNPSVRGDTSPLFFPPHQRRRAHFQTMLRLKPEATSYLDVGCGNGSSLEIAKSFNLTEVQGIEVRKEFCEAAKNRGLTIFEGSLDQCKENLGTYDLLALNDYLCITNDPKELLTLCSNLLKDKGIMMMQIPDIQSWPLRLLGTRWFHQKQHQYLSYFTKETITKLINETSFELLAISKPASDLTLVAILKKLQSYGFTWAERFESWLPQSLLAKTLLPINLGQMQILLRKKSAQPEIQATESRMELR